MWLTAASALTARAYCLWLAKRYRGGTRFGVHSGRRAGQAAQHPLSVFIEPRVAEFDLVATYQGGQLAIAEVNPIVAAALDTYKVGPALLFFKTTSCGLPFLLNRHPQIPVVEPALALAAAVYTVGSIRTVARTLLRDVRGFD